MQFFECDMFPIIVTLRLRVNAMDIKFQVVSSRLVDCCIYPNPAS